MAYTALLTSISAQAALASEMSIEDGYYCRVDEQGLVQGILGNGGMMATIIVSALIGGALAAPIYVLITRRFNRPAMGQMGGGSAFTGRNNNNDGGGGGGDNVS